MENDNSQETGETYISWSMDDFVRSTILEKNDYEPEAIALMVKELKRRGASQEELSASEEREEKRILEDAQKLRGINGFLLLFIVFLIINLFYLFWAGLKNMFLVFDNPSFLLLLLSALNISVGAYGVFTLYLLITKRKTAPYHTLRWIYSTLGIGIFNLIAVFLQVGKADFSDVVGPIMFSLTWATYFSRSKRVAVTYGLKDKETFGPDNRKE